MARRGAAIAAEGGTNATVTTMDEGEASPEEHEDEGEDKNEDEDENNIKHNDTNASATANSTGGLIDNLAIGILKLVTKKFRVPNPNHFP